MNATVRRRGTDRGLRRYGTVTHAGFGLGFERTILYARVRLQQAKPHSSPTLTPQDQRNEILLVEVLDGLDQIDWARLDDAFGEAGHVPDRIRTLLEPAVDRWAPALHELWDSLNQGCVYEATPPALPFLAWVATRRPTRCAHRILELLGHIASATDYWSRSSKPPWPMSPVEQHTFGRVVGESARAIADAAQTVLPTLSHPDGAVRLAAVYFVGQAAPVISAGGGPEIGRLRSLILEVFHNDADALVRGGAALALESFTKAWPEGLVHLRRALADELPPATLLCIALALCGGDSPLPERAVGVLNAAIANDRATDALFNQPAAGFAEWEVSAIAPMYRAAGFDPASIEFAHSFPWFAGRSSHQVVARVCATSPENLPRFVDALTGLLRRIEPSEFELLGKPILQFVFGAGQTRGGDRLTATQSAVLKALCDNPTLWMARSISFDHVLSNFGLPTNKADCDRLIDPARPVLGKERKRG